MEVGETLITAGNAIVSSKPLLVLKVSKYNVTVNSFSFPPSAEVLGNEYRLAASLVKGLESPPRFHNWRKEESRPKHESAELPLGAELEFHGEVTVEASYLNTKHDTMEILIEPFFTFVNVSYQTSRATLSGAFNRRSSDRPNKELSLKGAGTEGTSYCQALFVLLSLVFQREGAHQTFSLTNWLPFQCFPHQLICNANNSLALVLRQPYSKRSISFTVL